MFYLCETYGMPLNEMERRYDGYDLSDEVSLLNPKSVVSSIECKKMANYWSTTCCSWASTTTR